MDKFPVFKGFFFTLCSLFFVNCSFDYDGMGGAGKGQPDIIMDNVEYVRMRSLDPQARLQAERVERYEERRIMELQNFSFEQFGDNDEINVYGRAGKALYEIDSGDIRMVDGVLIEVDSENISIETAQLEWKDKERTLSGGANDEVRVYRENGTSFSGVGFQSNARSRSWSFSDTVSGTYINDDDKEDEEFTTEGSSENTEDTEGTGNREQ